MKRGRRRAARPTAWSGKRIACARACASQQCGATPAAGNAPFLRSSGLPFFTEASTKSPTHAAGRLQREGAGRRAVAGGATRREVAHARQRCAAKSSGAARACGRQARPAAQGAPADAKRRLRSHAPVQARANGAHGDNVQVLCPRVIRAIHAARQRGRWKGAAVASPGEPPRHVPPLPAAAPLSQRARETRQRKTHTAPTGSAIEMRNCRRGRGGAEAAVGGVRGAASRGPGQAEPADKGSAQPAHRGKRMGGWRNRAELTFLPATSPRPSDISCAGKNKRRVCVHKLLCGADFLLQFRSTQNSKTPRT